MTYPLPIVMRSKDGKTVEILFGNRIETYHRARTYTPKMLAREEGDVAALQNKAVRMKRWYDYIFNLDYWTGSGYLRVHAKSNRYDDGENEID